MFTCGELAKFTNPLTQFQGPLNIMRWFFRTNRVAYHQTAHPAGNICPVLVLSLVELADPEGQFWPFFISVDLYHSPSLSLNIQIRNLNLHYNWILRRCLIYFIVSVPLLGGHACDNYGYLLPSDTSFACFGFFYSTVSQVHQGMSFIKKQCWPNNCANTCYPPVWAGFDLCGVVLVELWLGYSLGCPVFPSLSVSLSLTHNTQNWLFIFLYFNN